MDNLRGILRIALGKLVEVGTTAQRTALNGDIFFGVIKMAIARMAVVPIAIEINFASLNFYLSAFDKGPGNFHPRRCVDPGKRRARNIH